MTASRKWLLGGIGVVILVFLLGWFFVVTPARNQAASLAEQVAYQNESNARAQAKLDLLRKESAEVPTKLAEIASVQAKMPEEVKQPELVRALQDQAATAGVDLTAVTPGEPTTLEGSTQGIIVLPMVLQATGRYPNIKTFVDDLEKLERAFLITNIEITREDETSDALNATITGRFFSLPKSAVETPSSGGTSEPPAAASAKLPKKK